MKNQVRWLVAATLVVAAVAAPTHVEAIGFGVKIKTPKIKGPEEKLNELDKRLDEAEGKLPRSYGQDADKEKAGLDAAEAILTEVAGEIDGGLKKSASNYDKVRGHLDALQAALSDGRLQNAGTYALGEINAFHVKGQAAPDEALARLDVAVAALERNASPGAKSAVEWWKKRASDLRARNPEIAAEAKRKADRAAREERAKAIREARGEAQAIEKELTEVTKARAAAIGEERLKAFEAAIAKVSEVHPPATALYAKRLRQLRAYNAWFAADAGATAKALAAQLDGEAVASGESKDKKLAVSFQAKPGWCYVVPMHWNQWTGGEKIDLDKLTTKGKTSALQRFQVRDWRQAAVQLPGVCTRQAAAVTLAGDLTFAGTRNAVRWAVVGWPKEKFPAYVASTVGVSMGDRCDVDAWYGLWTDPIPGTVVYAGGEPYLVGSADGESSIWMSGINVNGADSVRMKKDDIDSAPPAVRAFKTQVSFRGCPGSRYAEAPDSVKLAKCDDAIRAKYDKLFDTWGDKKKYAKSLSQYHAAEKKLEKLPDERDKEWSTRCGPTRKKIEGQWEATFNKIVDWYADNAPPVLLDRAAVMMDEYAAFE